MTFSRWTFHPGTVAVRVDENREQGGAVMKMGIRMGVALLLLIWAGVSLSGCGTAYSAARDERTLGILDGLETQGRNGDPAGGP